jgi:hypothetical protein
MEHAKKMMLVDERQYDELWKRSTIDASKSYLNNKLQTDLISNDISDDLKAKLYQQTLNRFLNQKQQLATSSDVQVKDPPPTVTKGKRKQWEPPTPVSAKRQKTTSPSLIKKLRRSTRETREPLRWTSLNE